MNKILKDLHYTETHEWVRIEGTVAFVGITDYAQESLGEVVYVELPEVNSVLEKGGTLGVVESVKAAGDIMSPISGTVIQINTNLENNPGLINENPYENWFAKVEIKSGKVVDGLMSAEEYKTLCQ